MHAAEPERRYAKQYQLIYIGLCIDCIPCYPTEVKLRSQLQPAVLSKQSNSHSLLTLRRWWHRSMAVRDERVITALDLQHLVAEVRKAALNRPGNAEHALVSRICRCIGCFAHQHRCLGPISMELHKAGNMASLLLYIPHEAIKLIAKRTVVQLCELGCHSLDALRDCVQFSIVCRRHLSTR